MRASSMSPAHGTQEPPVDISSQEDVEGRKVNNEGSNQVNWDALTQEEDATEAQISQVDDVGAEKTKSPQMSQKVMEGNGDKQEKMAVKEWQTVR